MDITCFTDIIFFFSFPIKFIQSLVDLNGNFIGVGGEDNAKKATRQDQEVCTYKGLAVHFPKSNFNSRNLLLY